MSTKLNVKSEKVKNWKSVHSGTDPTVHFSGIADDAEADAGQTAYLPDASTKVF